MNSDLLDEVKKYPRNVALNFEPDRYSKIPADDLTSIKCINFLVQSSSRFFLKADVGEIIDQMDTNDQYDNRIKGIAIDTEFHSELSGTAGEHFLMIAHLLVEKGTVKDDI
jgi:hypothetical protein